MAISLKHVILLIYCIECETIVLLEYTNTALLYTFTTLYFTQNFTLKLYLRLSVCRRSD